MKKQSIPEYIPSTAPSDTAAIKSAVDQQWVSASGPAVSQFEQDLERFTGAPHIVVTDSGTAALHLILAAAGIGRGDEVIVPDFTYGATALAVKQVGATPVFIDIEPDTLGMDPAKLQEMVSSDTAAILVAHLFGRPARMDAIQEIAATHEATVLEDACHSIGARYHGNMVGTLGAAGAYSFGWSKNMTTGKGGAVAVHDKDFLKTVRKLANYGRTPDSRYEFDIVGYNYRLDNIRASMGIEQLGRIEAVERRKEEIMLQYAEALQDICGITVSSLEDDRDVTPVPVHAYVLTDERDGLRQHLADEGVGTRPPFLPLHNMAAFSEGKTPVDIDVADRISRQMLCLPSHPSLTPEEIDYVISTITAYYD